MIASYALVLILLHQDPYGRRVFERVEYTPHERSLAECEESAREMLRHGYGYWWPKTRVHSAWCQDRSNPIGLYQR